MQNYLKDAFLWMYFSKKNLIITLLFWCFIATPVVINSHERCLRIIYDDKHSTFEELLNKDNSVSIHHKYINALAIEMSKLANGMSPEILNEIVRQETTLWP